MYVVYSPLTLVPFPTTENTIAPSLAVTVGKVTGLLDVTVTVMISPTLACVESTGLLLMIQYVTEGRMSDADGVTDGVTDGVIDGVIDGDAGDELTDGVTLTDDVAVTLGVTLTIVSEQLDNWF